MTSPDTKTLHCPNCKKPDLLATIEELEGFAECTKITSDGPEWNGSTEVIYDSSTTVGVYCQECDWEYRGSDWLDKLAS